MNTDIRRGERDAVAIIHGYAQRYADVLFRFPKSSSKEMEAIFTDLTIKQTYGVLKPIRTDAIDPRADSVWTICFSIRPGIKRDAYIFRRAGAVWVNVGGLQSGDAGGLVYQLAGAFAYNNSLLLVGDPDGITEAGKRRRLENMIALALKYDSVEFMRPHSDMLGWHGLMWSGGFFDKLLSMLRSSYKVASGLVPEVKEITYDPDTGHFYRGSIQLGRTHFDSLAERSKDALPAVQREGAPGSGTLRLGSLFQSLRTRITSALNRPGFHGGPLG